MSVIRGDNAILYFKVNNYYAPVACMDGWTLTTETEISETSTPLTGKSRTYRGNRNTYSISCTGLCSFDSNHSVVTMRLLQQQFAVIPISIVEIDDNGIGSTFIGNVIITSAQNNASPSDFENYSIEAKGTGDYTITEVPIDPNENCQDTWYYYTGKGTEGTSILITFLKGVSISGRIYRDGLEYRPSGIDQDGKGAPVGKQFSFNSGTGLFGFDPSLIPIALGEQIDIPYNLCGGALPTCDIIIQNVVAAIIGGKFNLSFDPVIDNTTTAPDDVSVRYSIDNGETWQIPDDISYDPDTDYNTVIINDALSTSQSYLFEVTPICNDVNGTAGTGYYFPCVAAGFSGGTPSLPDGIVGSAYNFAVGLTGSAPFTLTILDKPSWMMIEMLHTGGNYQIFFLGTPDTAGAGETVSFKITNCNGAILNFSDSINVTAAETNITFSNKNTCVTGDRFSSFDINAPEGTVLEFQLIMGGFFDWSNTVGNRNVTISASITLPAGLGAASISDYRPYTGLTGISGVSDVSPINVLVTVPTGGVLHVNVLANIENAGSGYSINGTFKIASVNGIETDYEQPLCVGFSTAG